MTSPFNEHTKATRATSHGAMIWMAGDYDQARQIIRDFCSDEGACFSINRTDYIYSGGEEAGFCVTSINYPRYERPYTTIKSQAERLGKILMKRLNQGSYTIETYGYEGCVTTFYSRRKSD